MKPVLAWHFLSADRRLGYGDGRLVRTRQTLRAEGEPMLCKNGMHGSRRILDALIYGQGAVVERVEIGTDLPYKIVKQEDRLVGTWRKTLWWIDAEMILHEFACREAEDVLKCIGITNEASWNAIRTKRLWMQGKATVEELNDQVNSSIEWGTHWPVDSATYWAICQTAHQAARWAADRAACSMAHCASDSITCYAIRQATYWATHQAVCFAQNQRLTAMVCTAYRQQKG